MALRQIRIQGDSVLEKVCRPVEKISPRIATLIEDMIDTMYENNGVGLAAPQVGVLRRIAVIDVGDGPIVLVNPVVLETSGEQTGEEGSRFRERQDRLPDQIMPRSGLLMQR